MQPSPLWYATRGAGVVSLVLLTASVVLGIITSLRWKGEDWPRFLVAALHRNLSLMLVIFGVLHAVTAIIDPVAGLSLKDAIVPFGSAYRPLWLGLGVVSAELLLAIALTSLLRQRLGYVAWRVMHWLTYATWPLAMLHSLGTGTDPHQGWFVLLAAGCTLAVLVAAFWRINAGLEDHGSLRLFAQAGCLASVVALIAWTAGGPLRPGWARAAGTPSRLLASGGATTTAALPAGLPAGLNDALSGRVSAGRAGLEVRLNDARRPGLVLTLSVPDPNGSRAIVSVSQNGLSVCTTQGSIGQIVTADCGRTRLSISLQSSESGAVVGRLTTASVS